MNKLAHRIIEELAKSAQGRQLSDIRIGLRYIGVKLDDGSIGIAYNFPESIKCDEISFPGQQRLINRNAVDVLIWLISDNQLNRSLALAVANGLAVSRKLDSINGDIRSVARINSSDTVVMIGHFGTIANDLREHCELLIYDMKATGGTNLNSSPPVEESLSKCNVALITATSLLNETADQLITASRDSREVVLLGPSTPLVPEAFRDTPVTLLSGVRAVDAEILSVISEGGGMKTFKPYVRKINCRKNNVKSTSSNSFNHS